MGAYAVSLSIHLICVFTWVQVVGLQAVFTQISTARDTFAVSVFKILFYLRQILSLRRAAELFRCYCGSLVRNGVGHLQRSRLPFRAASKTRLFIKDHTPQSNCIRLLRLVQLPLLVGTVFFALKRFLVEAALNANLLNWLVPKVRVVNLGRLCLFCVLQWSRLSFTETVWLFKLVFV